MCCCGQLQLTEILVALCLDRSPVSILEEVLLSLVVDHLVVLVALVLCHPSNLDSSPLTGQRAVIARNVDVQLSGQVSTVRAVRLPVSSRSSSAAASHVPVVPRLEARSSSTSTAVVRTSTALALPETSSLTETTGILLVTASLLESVNLGVVQPVQNHVHIGSYPRDQSHQLRVVGPQLSAVLFHDKLWETTVQPLEPNHGYEVGMRHRDLVALGPRGVAFSVKIGAAEMLEVEVVQPLVEDHVLLIIGLLEVTMLQHTGRVELLVVSAVDEVLDGLPGCGVCKSASQETKREKPGESSSESVERGLHLWGSPPQLRSLGLSYEAIVGLSTVPGGTRENKVRKIIITAEEILTRVQPRGQRFSRLLGQQIPGSGEFAVLDRDDRLITHCWCKVVKLTKL